jgi:hypothetical protein
MMTKSINSLFGTGDLFTVHERVGAIQVANAFPQLRRNLGFEVGADLVGIW